MSSLQRLVITSNGTKADFQSQCDQAPGGLPALNNIVDFLAGLAGGQRIGALLTWKVGAIQATGTIAFASTGPVNDQTCTICGVTFTAKTSASTSVQFTRSNTPAVNAVNLAAKLNAYFTGIMTAAVSGDSVIVTAVVPGLIGNGLFMVNVDLANTTITSFANGTDGTAYSQDLR